MTPTHLIILRTIAAHQPILKLDLYQLLPMPYQCVQVYLWKLRQQGYVRYERRKGPVWLTMRGKEVIENEV